MSAKALETASSLERFLNRNVLFVQGIDTNVPKSEVLQVLNQVLKQPQQGRVDILTTPDGKMRGSAFLNFFNGEEAKAALDKWRFALELRGRPLRMQFSSDREFKEVIQGPLVARFKVLIRNLPEELTSEALFDMFSQYGEILQVHRACDHYGQHYAIIQYVEISAVQSAIRHAHRERVLNHVLLLEPYKPNTAYGMLPRGINAIPPAPAAQPQPGQGAVSSTGGSTAGQGAGSGGGAATLPGTTYAALQQQQERELVEQERYSYSQRQSDSGSAAASTVPGAASAALSASNGTVPAAPADTAAAPPGATMAPVPSFYGTAAAGALHSPTAPGSLTHLLSTALHHVQAMEEHLCCPITQEPLVDPVVAADGNTYERLAIEAWLQQHDTSPMSNMVLPHKALVPNNLIRTIAEQLKGIRPPSKAADGGLHHGAAAEPEAAPAPAVPQVPSPVPIAPAPAPPPTHSVVDGGVGPDHGVPVPVPVPVAVRHSASHPMPDYGQMPVMRPQMNYTPVTFVHTIPQPPPPYQVQGTTYYAYRPMGM